MRTLVFAKRCGKEILRDPINLAFGLGFPVGLLLLLSAIQANVPTALFQIADLTAGIAVFGLSFMALFAGSLVAKDRESAFLQRLYATPMRAVEFILGYTLAMLPIALAQSLVCYLAAFALGLPMSVQVVYALLFLLPVALFFVGVGVLSGSVLSVKQTGGICGALLTNLTAFLSGLSFDLRLVGRVFEKIARCLPFVHAVEMEQALLHGNFAGILPHIWVVVAYAIAAIMVAVMLFLRQMRRRS